MANGQSSLKVLLQQRHLQGHRAFCREYDKLAKRIDPEIVGSWPSKAQFYRWLSREIRGLPHAHHCRVLEAMFPEWTAEQLFSDSAGSVAASQRSPNAGPAVTRFVRQDRQDFADVTSIFPNRAAVAQEIPPARLFDDAATIDVVGLSLNTLCQSYPDKSLLELLESGTVVQCLFLDPCGRHIGEREREESHPEGVLSTLTELNMQALQRLRTKLSAEATGNLHIRTYDEPVRFNITIIDGATCVVQPYLPDARGVESPTFVAEKQSGPTGLFDTFTQVFASMWARSSEVGS